MKITILGCGNAFSHNNYNQSFLLEENGKNFLVDCGTRIPTALYDQEIDLKSIDAVYISHAHGDHCGGIEEIAFSRYDWTHKPRHFSEGNYAPKLYANKVLMNELWNFTFKGGLDSMEGFDSTLETFFETMPVEPNKPFYWEDWRFDLVQQVHLMTGSMIKNTFGLFMSKEGHKKVFFTTDCQYFQPKQVRCFYDDADIIFQDGEFTGVDTKKKLFIFGSGVHASIAELFGWASANAMVLTSKIKSKLWVSHYQDFVAKFIPKKQKKFVEYLMKIASECTDPVSKIMLEEACSEYMFFESKDSFGNLVDWDSLVKEEGLAGIVRVGQEFEV